MYKKVRQTEDPTSLGANDAGQLLSRPYFSTITLSTMANGDDNSTGAIGAKPDPHGLNEGRCSPADATVHSRLMHRSLIDSRLGSNTSNFVETAGYLDRRLDDEEASGSVRFCSDRDSGSPVSSPSVGLNYPPARTASESVVRQHDVMLSDSISLNLRPTTVGKASQSGHPSHLQPSSHFLLPSGPSSSGSSGWTSLSGQKVSYMPIKFRNQGDAICDDNLSLSASSVHLLAGGDSRKSQFSTQSRDHSSGPSTGQTIRVYENSEMDSGVGSEPVGVVGEGAFSGDATVDSYSSIHSSPPANKDDEPGLIGSLFRGVQFRTSFYRPGRHISLNAGKTIFNW
ncbi:unnamed protein product [Protopolystoma xenopodis]|uniref:Uncharacterized protein n=1 Tax=Protopolystoma xenopodis TaxID=117903 RepID=A0A3S5CL54_9PLAT|nr:unnamed protein product [Protopolystoma xenopodis]